MTRKKMMAHNNYVAIHVAVYIRAQQMTEKDDGAE